MATPRRQQPPAQPGIPPEAYLAAAGGALGARAAGEPPEPPDSAARKALILLILARVAEYVKRARARRMEIISERVRAAAAAEADVAEVLELESAAETAYAVKQKERIRRELELIAAIPDARERAEAVRRLMRQERRIDRQRDEMSAARSYAAVQRLELRRQSPAGAYWRLGVREQHCPVCLFLAGRFWPWEVLDQVHPPVHPNCGCELYGLGSAIALGFMRPGDVPDKAAAIAAASGVVLNEEEVAELQLDLLLESDAGRLMEAAFGTFKWDAHLHPRDNLGQFVETLAALKTSAAGGKIKAVQLGDKTRVSRDKDGTWRVVRSGGIIKGFTTPQDAALDAVNRTLKAGEIEEAPGVFSKYKDFDTFLKGTKNGDPNDNFLLSSSFFGGGANAAAPDIQSELDRLNAEIAEISLVGDKYEQRRLPTLKKRAANLAKKVKKAPAAQGGLPPVDPPEKPEEHKKAEGFKPGDIVKWKDPGGGEVEGRVLGPSPIPDMADAGHVEVEITQSYAGSPFPPGSKPTPHQGVLTKLSSGGDTVEMSQTAIYGMVSKMEPGQVYAFKTGAGQEITVMRSANQNDYAIKSSAWEDNDEPWSTGHTAVQVAGWVKSHKAHSPMEWSGGAKVPVGDPAHPPAVAPEVTKAKKDHSVAYAQVATALGAMDLGELRKYTTGGGKEWSVYKYEQPGGQIYSVKQVGSGFTATEFTGKDAQQKAAAHLALEGAAGSGEKYTPQTGMPTGAVAASKPPPAPPKPPEPDAHWDSLPTGSALGSKLTQLQKTNFALLSSTEKSAIGAYTGSSYHDMNKQLREEAGVGDAHTEERIAAMDSAFEKMEGMSEDVLIWRGISTYGETEKVVKNYKNAPVGSVIRDNGFISSSTDESMAKGWAGNIVLKIRWPKGAKALWVSAGGGHDLSSQGSGEREIILPRGVGFKIVAKRQLSNTKTELAVEPISGHRG